MGAHTPIYKYCLASSLHLLKIETEHQFGLESKCGEFAQGTVMHVYHPTWIDCNWTASGVIQNLLDYDWKLATSCWGAVLSCATVKSSWRDFENKANGIPASSLPLCCFTGRKYARREKWGEGMWILFGGETKQQTKEDEADSPWRRLLYCKIAAASPSERKKKIYKDAFTYINIKKQTVNSPQPPSLQKTCKSRWIVHFYKADEMFLEGLDGKLFVNFKAKCGWAAAKREN